MVMNVLPKPSLGSKCATGLVGLKPCPAGPGQLRRWSQRRPQGPNSPSIRESDTALIGSNARSTALIP